MTTEILQNFLFHFHLYWYDGFAAVCGQVDIRNNAVVIWYVSQEDKHESTESIRHDAGTEQEEDNLLEMSPLTQKGNRIGVILHSQKNRLLCRTIVLTPCLPATETCTVKYPEC